MSTHTPSGTGAGLPPSCINEGSSSAPSLQSVAEAAARPQHPLCAVVAEQAIGEVQEFAEVLYANGWASPNDAQWTALTKFVNDLKALVRIKADRHFAPLLAQYEQRVRELEEENTTLRGSQKACEDCMTPTYAALRTRCAELEEDKAALDWLEQHGERTLRAAIRAARTKENQP